MQQLKEFFDNWIDAAGEKYDRKQWLLSKWEVCDGIEWPEEKIALMVRTIREGLRLEPSHLLADLGCGGGWIAERLRPSVRGVIGLDFCLDMLLIARRSGKGPWLQGDIGKLPFRTDSLDRVLSYFVFLNFTDDAFVENAILDVVRVMRREGIALIGQLPDEQGSADYERAKGDYFDYCGAKTPLGDRNDEGMRAPLRLFNREKVGRILADRKIRYEFRPSFNPFYHPGAPETVTWRFDLLIYKD